MKLPIRKKYFDDIKAGRKYLEYRDSHITFVCEETGETLRKEVVGVCLVYSPKEFLDGDILSDKMSIKFTLEKD